jgi:hypothetical protein
MADPNTTPDGVLPHELLSRRVGTMGTVMKADKQSLKGSNSHESSNSFFEDEPVIEEKAVYISSSSASSMEQDVRDISSSLSGISEVTLSHISETSKLSKRSQSSINSISKLNKRRSSTKKRQKSLKNLRDRNIIISDRAG